MRKIKVNIDELIKFYDSTNQWDTKNPELNSPITAITGLIGEDLILSVLKHYFDNDRKKISTINRVSPCTGNNKGPRLDAWMITDKEYYQIEVKNWCASAIGGKPIDDDIPKLNNNIIFEGSKFTKPDNKGKKPRKEGWSLLEASIYNYHKYLLRSDSDHTKKVWKVLCRMEDRKLKDIDNKTKKALLAFWSPVAKNQEYNKIPPAFFSEPLDTFELPINASGYGKTSDEGNIEFNEVFIFSASLYLRALKERGDKPEIELEMPRVEDRLKRIHQLLPGVFSALSKK